MVPLIALAVLVQAAHPVTFATRGSSVETVLKEVSKQTGVAMEAMPQTKGDIVIVAVKDVSLEDFRDRLAKVIGAKWLKEGNVLRLARPIELERAQIAAERKQRVEEVKTGIEALRKKVSQQPAFDAQVAHTLAQQVYGIYTKYKGHTGDSPGLEAIIGVEPNTPGGRLAICATAALTPDQIADVEPGGRIVYSTEPTAMQRRLPDAVLPFVKRYLTEQQLYVDELTRLPFKDQIKNSFGATLSTTTPEDPAVVIMATERSPYNPNFTVHIKLVKKDGKLTGQLASLLDLPTPPSTQVTAVEGKIAPSSDSARLLAAMKSLQAGKTFVEDQGLVSQLRHLEDHDPLSYIVCDGLLALSKQDNLIASVSDDAFSTTLFEVETPDSQIDLQRYSKWLNKDCDVTHEKGWFLVSPKNMLSVRRQRLDRRIASNFYQAANESDGASLDEMAEFVLKLPRNYMDTLAPFLAFFVYPELNAGISDRNVELLRVYGRLTPNQKLELATQGRMTVGALTQASIDDLNYLAFRADSPMMISIRTEGPGPSPEYEASISSEVTVALPNGVPQKATLTMYGQKHDAVLIDTGVTNYSTYQPISASSLAYMLAQAETADPSDKRERVHIEKYRFGHTRHITLNLQLSETISVGSDFDESKFPKKSSAVPYEQLPQDFRSAVEAAMKQARDQVARSGAKKLVPPP